MRVQSTRLIWPYCFSFTEKVKKYTIKLYPLKACGFNSEEIRVLEKKSDLVEKCKMKIQ